MTDDKFDPDESHFSDEELERLRSPDSRKNSRTIRYPAMPVIPVMPIKQRTLLQRSPIPTRMMIRLIRLPLIPAGL